MRYSAILLLLLAGAGRAEGHWCGLPRAHPVDAAYARAMERSGGVTVDMHDAQAAAYAGWDAVLNRLYRNAIRSFGKDVRATALRDAQRAWLAWDEAETRSDLAAQADGGSIGPVIVSGLAMQRRRERACTLYNMQESDPASN